MNPIHLLTNGINDLWFWTYSIIIGWGASFTVVVAIMIIFAIKLIKVNQRINQLESRLVHAERDYNLSINQQKSK
jgi:hypothetical protein